MKKFLIFTVTFLTYFIASAQLTDLIRVEYTYFPQSDSDNSFRRKRALLRAPIKLNDKGAYLVPGLEFRDVNFRYADNPSPPFDTSNLDDFQSWDLSVGYTYKMKEDLRFAARAGALLASNFEGEGIDDRDIRFSGALYLIKDKTDDTTLKRPYRLIIGLSYNTKAGRPFPLPFVNYYRKFKPKWSYSLGIPKTNLKYFLNDKNNFQVFATLDGFWANIQRNRIIPGINGEPDQSASTIGMIVALGGLGYERYLTKHIVFYAYAGYTFINDIRLRNDDADDVFTVNDANTFYARGGLKFKI